jgi:hypothetical protein
VRRRNKNEGSRNKAQEKIQCPKYKKQKTRFKGQGTRKNEV